MPAVPNLECDFILNHNPVHCGGKRGTPKGWSSRKLEPQVSHLPSPQTSEGGRLEAEISGPSENGWSMDPGSEKGGLGFEILGLKEEGWTLPSDS